jgi:hypothetical protein
MQRFLISFTGSITMLLLQACGGGGGDGDGDNGSSSPYPSYSGVTTEAKIEADNSEDLGTAAASAAWQAKGYNLVGENIVYTEESAYSVESKMLEISPNISTGIIQSERLSAAKTTEKYDCYEGGYVIEEYDDDGVISKITSYECTFQYSEATFVWDGTLDYTYTWSNNSIDSVSITYLFTETVNGESEFMKGTRSCVDYSTSCMAWSLTAEFFGLDNRVFRVNGLTASGDGSSGYDVTGTVYDPDHGYVQMTPGTTAITFGCGNKVPGTGQVVLTDSDGTSATVSFDSCESFSVSISGGESNTYEW